MQSRRIGVTGHRWNRLRRSAASDLEREFLAAFRHFDPKATGDRTLVCGMAEGADLMAAACRPARWSLEAALPLPPTDWRAHLARQPGVTGEDLALHDRLMHEAFVVTLPHVSAEPGFLALALHLVQTCTGIIAVWDGAAGFPGGTGDVVAMARSQGVDLRIIDAGPFLIV